MCVSDPTLIIIAAAPLALYSNGEGMGWKLYYLEKVRDEHSGKQSLQKSTKPLFQNIEQKC